MNVNDFKKIFNDINFNNDSILGYNKTKFIYEEIIEIKNHLHTAEVGVYKGYTSKLIATINSNNFHFCYDTFSGVVKYDELIDKVVDGSFSSSIEEVKELINLPNVIYKSGIFPETFQENNYRFSFFNVTTFTPLIDASKRVKNPIPLSFLVFKSVWVMSPQKIILPPLPKRPKIISV